MRKFLFFVMLFIMNAAIEAQPVIKVGKYKLIAERAVTRKADQVCFRYEAYGELAQSPNVFLAPPMTCFSSLSYCPTQIQINEDLRQNRLVGLRYDNTCYYDRLSDQIDYVSLEFGRLGKIIKYNLDLSQIPKGNTRIFRDTIDILDPYFAGTNLNSSLYQYDFYRPEEYRIQAHIFDFNIHQSLELYATRNLGNGYFEEHFESGRYNTGDPRFVRFDMSNTIKGIPSFDNAGFLPTDDKIGIYQTTTLSYIPIWQYLNPISNQWANVPAGLASNYNGMFTVNPGNALILSAKDLFGASYGDYLNKSVVFRTTNSTQSIFSNLITMTVTLSAPHIISVVAKNMDCNKSGAGELKINFDRPMFSGERLNIFLSESTRRVDFSKLNIQSLDADNSYSYTGLSAGSYKINLLGKYADGLVSDLNIDTRDPLVSEYVALNTINFNNGFNTSATDNFTAYTDYTSYASVTYTGDVKHSAQASITEPFAVSAMVTVKDTVSCKGGNSGVINIAAWGGNKEAFNSTSTTVPHYYKYAYKKEGDAGFSQWIDFTNTTLQSYTPANLAVKQTVIGLLAGKYVFKIRDKYDCFTMDANGNERLDTVIITEPEKGITLDVLDIRPITTHNATDAMATIKVSGGNQWPLAAAGVENPKPHFYTNIELSYNNTILQPSVQYTQTSVDGIYTIVTNNQLAAGNYLLKLTDKNGCIFEKSFTIVNPEVLVATINKRQQVTCHGDMDAALAASAAGGVQDADHPVIFKWYRVSGESGDVELLNGVNQITVRGNLIEGLAPGTYKVKAVDRFNNIAWETFVVEDPTPLIVTTTSTKASCYSSDDGTMRVLTVTGGTPYKEWEGRLFTYDYEWSNGSLVPIVNRVRGGDYVVVVKDSLGCIGTQTQVVEAAARVISTQTVQPITCFGSNNGQVTVTATGGTTTATSPYTYLWSTGATTPTLSSLAPGEYWYKVIDANTCYDSVGIKLEQPESFTPVVEAERKLCIGQTIRLDASVPGVIAPLTYSWQQPGGGTANESTIYITAPGLYTVTVANASGCTKSASINIVPQNTAITTEFVVSTQAFKNDKVLLVNLSQPNDQTQVEWLLPQSNGRFITFASQSIRNCELVFSDTGRFAITMRVHYASGCVDEVVKYVNVIEKATVVNPGSGAEAFLKLYSVVYPNPSDGTFSVKLKFSKATRAKMRLVNTLTNQIVNSREINITDAEANQYHTELYSLGGTLIAGMYVLVIDTPKGDFVYKVEIL